MKMIYPAITAYFVINKKHIERCAIATLVVVLVVAGLCLMATTGGVFEETTPEILEILEGINAIGFTVWFFATLALCLTFSRKR